MEKPVHCGRVHARVSSDNECSTDLVSKKDGSRSFDSLEVGEDMSIISYTKPVQCALQHGDEGKEQ